MVVNTTAVAVLLITFFALILLRVNIAFAVGAASTLVLCTWVCLLAMSVSRW